MGSGKSLSAVALAYTEVVKRQVLIEAINCVLKDKKWAESVEQLCKQFSISPKFAESQLREALQIYQEEGSDAGRMPRRVISNNHLNFPYELFNPEYFLEHIEDEELSDCILLLDEAYIYLDARSTSTKLNKLFTYFIAQTRKRDVDMYVCTHHRDVLDKRLRRAINIRGTCRYNKGPLEENKPIAKRRWNWARVTFTNIDTGQERRVRFYGPAFFSLYSTEERVPLLRRQMEITL